MVIIKKKGPFKDRITKYCTVFTKYLKFLSFFFDKLNKVKAAFYSNTRVVRKLIKQKILANDFYKMLAEERSLFQKHSDYSNKLMTGLYIGLAIYGGPASLLAYGLIEGARSGIRAINNPFLNKLDSSLQFTQLLMNPWPAVFSKGAAALTGKVFDTLLDPHSTTPKWARSWLVTAKPYSVAAANYGGSRLGHYTAKKYIPETFQNFQNMAVALSKQVSQQVYFQNQTDVFSTNQQSEEGPVSFDVKSDEPFSETAENQGESFNPEIRELKPETQSTQLVVGEDEVQTHSVIKPERTGAIEDRWSATYESKVSSNNATMSAPDFVSSEQEICEPKPGVRSILESPDELNELAAASNASRLSGGVTFDPNTQSAVPSPFINQEAVCSLDESPGSKPSKPLPFLVTSKETSSHGSFDVSADKPSKLSEATAGICSVSEASQSGSVANPPIGESVTGSGVVLFDQTTSVSDVSDNNLITIEVIPSQLGEQGKAAFSEFLSQNPSLVEPVSSAMQNGLSSFKIVQTDSGFQVVTDDVMSPTLELGAPESVGFNKATMCDAKDHSKSLEISEIQALRLTQPLPRFTEGSAGVISTQVTKPVSSSIVDRTASSTGNPYETILSSRQTVSLSQAALECVFPVETSEPTKEVSLYFSHSKAEEAVCSLPKQHSVVVRLNQDNLMCFAPLAETCDALPGVTYSTNQSQVAILDSSVTTNQVNPLLDSSSQAHLELDLNEMDANGIAFLNTLVRTKPELLFAINKALSNNGIVSFSIPKQEIPVILSLYQGSSSAVSFYGGSSTPRLPVPTSQSVKLNPKSTLDFGASGRLISGICGSTTDSSLSPTINADGKPVVFIPSTAAPVFNLGKFTAAPKGSFVPEINTKSLLASSTFFNQPTKRLEDKCPVKSEAYPVSFGPPKSRSFLVNVAMNRDPSTPEEVQSSNPGHSYLSLLKGFVSLLKGFAMTDTKDTDKLDKRIRSVFA